MSRSGRLFLMLALLALAVDALVAQQAPTAVFRGIVTSDLGQRPVGGAEIAFKNIERLVRSGSDGHFLFTALPAGKFTVTVRRPGYRPIDGTVTLAATDTIDWQFDMVAAAGTELSPVEVHVNADSARPGLREFERRRQSTSGHFITEGEILRIGSTNLANIIRTKVSGFDLTRHPSGSGTALAARRTGVATRGVNDCYTAVWMNGQLFFAPTRGDDPPRLEDINLQELAAVELYRVSEVPPELNFRSGNCGVMVLWTMIARRKYPPPE